MALLRIATMNARSIIDTLRPKSKSAAWTGVIGVFANPVTSSEFWENWLEPSGWTTYYTLLVIGSAIIPFIFLGLAKAFLHPRHLAYVVQFCMGWLLPMPLFVLVTAWSEIGVATVVFLISSLGLILFSLLAGKLLSSAQKTESLPQSENYPEC